MSHYDKIRSQLGHDEVGLRSTAAHAQDCTEAFVARLGRQPKLKGNLIGPEPVLAEDSPTNTINLAVVVENDARAGVDPKHLVSYDGIKWPETEYKQPHPKEQTTDQT